MTDFILRLELDSYGHFDQNAEYLICAVCYFKMGIHSLWHLWWIIDTRTRLSPSPSGFPDYQIFTTKKKFKYLDSEISYENDNIPQQVAKFAEILEILNSTFKNKFGPEIVKCKV